jgi:hypothetical protein
VAIDENARLEIGRVVNRTFAAIGGNIVTFLILAVLFGAVPSVASNYVSGAVQLSILAGGVASTTDSNYVLVGSITHGSVVFWNGRTASLGECLSTSLRYLLPLMGAALLVGICLLIGFAALLVPGIMLAIMWSAVSPSIVVEGAGVFQAMQRSRELTKGHRWKIFWLLVIYVLILLIFQWVMLRVLGFAGAQSLPAAAASGNIAALIIYVVYVTVGATMASAGTAALYFELRVAKDGVNTNELAAVFA